MKKIKPIVPQSHMDAAYRGMFVSLASQLDQLYVRHAELTAVKAPSDQENDELAAVIKPIGQLEKEWNTMVKTYVPTDRAEQKRCTIVITP